MNGLIQACLSIPLLVSAPPLPSSVPKSWNLGFEYHDLQRISVALPGRDIPQSYVYLLYTVVNDSGGEVAFYPRFEVVTSTGKRLTSEVGVSPVVFEAVKKRHAKTHPFLQNQAAILGRLLQSADQAKDGVAIWPDFSAMSDKFTVYVAGLSGESMEVPNPGYRPDQPETVEERLADGTSIPYLANPRRFTLHRTLAIHYDLPGDARTRSQAKPVRTGQEWVMR